MLQGDNIKVILFAVLCLCSVFYLFLGIYTYNNEKRSKTRLYFLGIGISTCLWAIGYALMLISPNIEIANIWRIISAIGWCYFNAIFISFTLSLNDTRMGNSHGKLQILFYMASTIFFISTLLYKPSEVLVLLSYGFVDNLYFKTFIGSTFSIYLSTLFLVGIAIVYFRRKNTHKNRVKIQMNIILITSLISIFIGLISDIILPIMGYDVYPTGIITLAIGMVGMWYAINKYKMMSISHELISEYIFDSVNEPILILGEDLLVKDCNKVSMAITGCEYEDLIGNSLDKIIYFRNFNFNTIIQTGNVADIEVDLFRNNNEALVCELSATSIYDEYKDLLGIHVLLHDVSERKRIEEIQKCNTLKLEESNLKLEKEITDKLLAEEQIRYFVYNDVDTDLSNKKKMLEYVNILRSNKDEKFAILYIDLDKFKSVNDNYGHQVGDDILKIVATRLKSIIKSSDAVSRIGGDEFTIILGNLKDYASAEKIAIAVVKTLSAAFIYQGNQIFIGASIGISIFPEHGIDVDVLINRADLAMYVVKRDGGNGYKIYTSEMNE